MSNNTEYTQEFENTLLDNTQENYSELQTILATKVEDLLQTLAAIEDEAIYNEMIAKFLTPDIQNRLNNALSLPGEIEQISSENKNLEDKTGNTQVDTNLSYFGGELWLKEASEDVPDTDISEEPSDLFINNEDTYHYDLQPVLDSSYSSEYINFDHEENLSSKEFSDLSDENAVSFFKNCEDSKEAVMFDGNTSVFDLKNAVYVDITLESEALLSDVHWDQIFNQFARYTHGSVLDTFWDKQFNKTALTRNVILRMIFTNSDWESILYRNSENVYSVPYLANLPVFIKNVQKIKTEFDYPDGLSGKVARWMESIVMYFKFRNKNRGIRL